ncbi:MAG: putative metal-binding motif-containing protein, partial [Myxococcota bacterium]
MPADEDCDDDDPAIGAGLPTYADLDADGYGDPATELLECVPSEGRVTNPDDCDDTDADVSPAATEICDGLDNDCDPSTSEDGRVERTGPDGVRTDDTALWTGGAEGAPVARVLDLPASWDLCGVRAFVSLDIQADVVLRGHGGAILDGGGAARVLQSVAEQGSPEDPEHTVTLAGLTLQGGRLERFGACVFVDRTALVLEDVTITDCITDSDGLGGALAASEAHVVAVGGSFVANGSRTGGAVAGSNSIGEFTGTTFVDNGSQYLVGPILGADAGALSWARGPLTLDGVTITDHAAESGGAVLVGDTDLTLHDVVWERNVAERIGGALFAVDSTVTLEGGRFESNDAGTGGGAMYLRSTSLQGSLGSVFQGNTGADGAGVYLEGSTAVLDGATFTGNLGSNRGGAIYLGQSLTTLSGSTLEGNRAPFGGGAFFVGGQLLLTGNDWI